MLTKFFVKDFDYGTNKNIDIRIIDNKTKQNMHLVEKNRVRKSLDKDSQPSFRTALSPDNPKVPKSALLSPEKREQRVRGFSMSRKSARFANFDIENLSQEDKILLSSPIVKEFNGKATELSQSIEQIPLDR